MKNKSTTTDKKIKKYVAKMKRDTEIITASTSTARAFLISTGIYTSNGNLKKVYK